MNKLMQKSSLDNNIQIIPVGWKIDEMDDKQEIEWCEKICNHLLHDDLARHSYRARRASHTLSVWSDNDYVYLVQVIRAFGANQVRVWMAKYSEDQVSDFKAIVKFIHNNLHKLNEPYEKLKDMINHDTGTKDNESNNDVVWEA